MLPPELFALVLMVTGTSGGLQEPAFGNTTNTALPTASIATETSTGDVHAESLTNGSEETVISSSHSVHSFQHLTIHLEHTATGFEDAPSTSKNINTPPVKNTAPGLDATPSPTFKAPNSGIVVTSTPRVVAINTQVQPAAQPGLQQPGVVPTAVRNSPQTAAIENSLLSNIVSHLGTPTSPADSGPDSDGNVMLAGKATEANPGQTATFMTAGGQITIGSAVLTLTPGLSSMIGVGSTATYVAIMTDDAGQTLITVSSSGTAVTATITNALTTLTQSDPAFDSSITAAAASGNAGSTLIGGAVETASSQGGTTPQRTLSRWPWICLGLTGLKIVVG